MSRGQQKQTRWIHISKQAYWNPNRNVRQKCFRFIQDAGQIAQRWIGTLFKLTWSGRSFGQGCLEVTCTIKPVFFEFTVMSRCFHISGMEWISYAKLHVVYREMSHSSVDFSICIHTRPKARVYTKKDPVTLGIFHYTTKKNWTCITSVNRNEKLSESNIDLQFVKTTLIAY